MTKPGRPEGLVAEWFDWVSSQGCLVCNGPAEVHHCKLLDSPKTGLPLPRRKGINYWAVVPLCHEHHRTGPNPVHGKAEGDWFEGHGIDPLQWFANSITIWINQKA